MGSGAGSGIDVAVGSGVGSGIEVAVGSGTVAAVGTGVGEGSSPQATTTAAKEATIRSRNNARTPPGDLRCFESVQLGRVLSFCPVRHMTRPPSGMSRLILLSAVYKCTGFA